MTNTIAQIPVALPVPAVGPAAAATASVLAPAAPAAPATLLPGDARAVAQRFLDALLGAAAPAQLPAVPSEGAATPVTALVPPLPGETTDDAAADAQQDDDSPGAEPLPLQAMAAPLPLLPQAEWPPALTLPAAPPAAAAFAPDVALAAVSVATSLPQALPTASTGAPRAAAYDSPAARAPDAAGKPQGPAPLPADAAQPPDAGTTTALDTAPPSALQAAARAAQALAAAPEVQANRTTGSADTPEQRLVQALGERLSLNLQRGSERALIRLDPPLQGQLEIAIRHEGGAIQVHLSASHGDVVRQLQTITEGLRQELQQRQGAEVTVQVSHSGAGERGADGRARQQPQPGDNADPGQALAEAERGTRATRFALDAQAS